MTLKITKSFFAFIEDESGPTAVEYAVMIALIITVCIASITQFGQGTNDMLQNSADVMQQINANNSGN